MMNTILLITRDSTVVERFRSALPAQGLFWVTDVESAADAVARGNVDVCMWDLALDGSQECWPGLLNQFRHAAPHLAVVALGPGTELTPRPTFMLPRKASPDDILRVMTAAVAQRVDQELGGLRYIAPRPAAAPSRQTSVGAPAHALTEFSRAFASVLDLPRALDAFLNAVGDLVRPARSAVLLREPDAERLTMAARRGFQQSPGLTLSMDSRLVQWLAREGRPVSMDVGPGGVASELARLNAAIALPLIADAQLLGILALGPPAVRSAYADSDLETLFELGMHLALALRAAEIHRELEEQKRLVDSVLAHMASGVITLGRDERILSVNHRAAQILGLDATELRGAGIRALPSPLGDLLASALYSSLPVREELQLPGTTTWLAVAAAPVPGEPTPRAAVLTLEDITAQRSLAEQQRTLDQMRLLTAVVSRIADEIKNPLVSVRTFTELLPERYDDPSFRKDFGAVVARDVQRLLRVFETLTTLVSPPLTYPRELDVNAFVEDLARQAGGQLAFDAVEIRVAQSDGPLVVAADQRQLTYALMMLIDFLATHSSPSDRRMTLSARRSDGNQIVVKLESPTAMVPTEQLHALFDPLAMVHQGLKDVGPVVASRIAAALGGSLRCEQERASLVFRLALPSP
jgi:PAS domain S-box-containing protein